MQVESDPSKLVTVRTKDGVEYKINHQLFCNYSRYYNTMSQDSEQEVFNIYNINSTQFDYLYEFMQLHKHKAPQALRPLQPGVSLRTVMEEADAELIQRIFACNAHRIKLVIDAAFFLLMDELLRRLTAGIMATRDKSTNQKLIQEGKKSGKVDELEVSKEIHKKIQMILFKNKQKQALEAEEQLRQGVE